MPEDFNYTYNDYDTLQYINYSNHSHRLVGTFSPDIDISKLGWELDIGDMSEEETNVFRNLLDDNDDYRLLNLEAADRNHLYMGQLSLVPTDGIAYDYWQPGVGASQDLMLEQIELSRSEEEYPIYRPVVRTGYYSIGPEQHFLYSNISVLDHLDITTNQLDITSGITYSNIVLSHVPNLASPILARIYKRDSCGAASIYRDYKHVDQFYGILSNEERLDTLGDPPIWTNVDNRFHHEFIVNITNLDTEPSYKLIFNQSATKTFALPDDFLTSTFTDNDIEGYLDYVGLTQGRACETVYSNYLPLYMTSYDDVAVYLYNRALDGREYMSTIEEWAIVDTLDFSLPSDKHVVLDSDLGMITFGGQKAESTRLCSSLTIESDSFTVISGSGFSNRGLIKLVDPNDSDIYENILYYHRDGDLFSTLDRGILGTTTRAWSSNTIVEDVQAGAIPSTGLGVALAYTAIPRIEYEPVLDSASSTELLHQARKATVPSIDLNPLKNTESEGLLYMHRCPMDVAYLVINVLDRDTALGYSNTYGPVYVGPDYVTISVCAFSIFDMPVPGATITINLSPNIGSIDGASALTLVTGSDGCVTFAYKAPTNPEDLGVYSTRAYASGVDTAIEFEKAAFSGLSTDEVYLYQVTKDDSMLGTEGYSGTIEAIEDSIYIGAPSSRTCATVFSNLEPGFFDGGIVTFTYDDGSTQTREVTYFTDAHINNALFINPPTTNEEMISNLRAKVFHFKRRLPAGTIVSYRAVQKDAVQWDPNILNGRKTIVYKLEDQTLLTHPSMDLDMVYGPLRPSSILSDNTLLYSGTLDHPDPHDPDEVLGAYWSVSPVIVSVQASTRDNLCDSGIILSEEVKLLVTLPPSMLGVYVAATQKVPYGFRIVSENFDAASVLNAATFLNINTVARSGSYGPYISGPAVTGGDIELTTDTMSLGFAAVQHIITIT